MDVLMVLIVLVLACGLAGLVGLGLLIAGLVSRKQGMWLAGLCVMLLALIGGVAGGAFLFVKASEETVLWVDEAWTEVKGGGPSTVPEQTVRDLFRDELSRPLPPDTKILNANEVTVFAVSTTYYIRLRAGGGFEDWLTEAGFESTPPEREDFALPEGWEQYVPWWDASAAAADRTYTRTTGAVDEGGFEFRLGHNTQTGEVYVIAEEYR